MRHQVHHSLAEYHKVTSGMINAFRALVFLALPFVLLLHPVAATLVPEAMNLPDHLAMFCPDVDVCPERISMDWNYTRRSSRGRVACCTECSCDDACVQTNNCCFPPTDLHPDSKCLYPTTKPSAKEETLLYKSYRMIDIDASKNSIGSTSEASRLQNAEKIPCGEISHPPFGNLFPVYSKQLNKIYKNPTCAASHGVNDGVVWQPRLFCLNYNLPQTSAVLQTLEYGMIPAACYVDFAYPGKQSDLDLHVCYRDLKHTCDRESFPIPERLNISATQVRALCESGFISPGRQNLIPYANVFCHICDGIVLTSYRDTSKYCSPEYIGRGKQKAFSYLINLNHVGKRASNAKVIIPKVCDDRHETLNSSNCRELKCPIYQSRGQNGKCELMLYRKEDVNILVYMIVVRVHIDGFKISPNDDFKASMDDLVRLWNKINPWPKHGRIMCVLDSKNDSSPQINSLLVQILISPEGNMPLQTFLKNVKTDLNKRWVMEINGSYIELYQSIAKFADVSVIGNKKFNSYGYRKCVPKYYQNMDPVDLLAYNITEPLLLLVQETGYFYVTPVLNLNQLHYCEQIELQSPEFILFKVVSEMEFINAQALYNKHTGRLMLENEFLLVNKPNKDVVARICLSDSGYKKKIQTSGADLMHACLTLVLTLGWSALHMIDC